MANVYTWTKYNNAVEANSDTTGTDGRIPRSSTAGKNDDTQVAAYGSASVIKVDDTHYKMWYMGWQGNCVQHATSSDGLTWTKYNITIETASDTTGTDGRIPKGTSGHADAVAIYCPSVILDGSTYKMWYLGTAATGYFQVCYATSSDGLTWTKYNNDVEANSDTTGTDGRLPQSNSAGKADSALERGLSVIKDGSSSYKMWYTGGSFSQICLAESSDGLTWTKKNIELEAVSDTTGTDGRIPKGSTAGRADVAGVFAHTVIKDTDGSYLMWYTGTTTQTAVHAYSSDGLTWTKLDNSAPSASDTSSTNSRIALGTSTKGDDLRVYPNSVFIDGTILRLYYCGHDGAVMRIYMATADVPDDSSSSSSMSVSSSSSSKSESSSSTSSGPCENDENTLLLLHMNGANTSQTFVDSSQYENTVTANGNAQQTSANQKFWNTATLDGTGDFLAIADNARWDFGTSNWTIEYWIYKNGTNTNGGVFGAAKATGGASGYTIYFSTAGGKLYLISDASGSWASDLIMDATVAATTWTHHAWVRNGNTVSLYVNGTAQATTKDVTGYAYNCGGSGLTIGRIYNDTDNYYFTGQLDEVRVCNSAKYTENFTAPTRQYSICVDDSSSSSSSKSESSSSSSSKSESSSSTSLAYSESSESTPSSISSQSTQSESSSSTSLAYSESSESTQSESSSSTSLAYSESSESTPSSQSTQSESTPSSESSFSAESQSSESSESTPSSQSSESTPSSQSSESTQSASSESSISSVSSGSSESTPSSESTQSVSSESSGSSESTQSASSESSISSGSSESTQSASSESSISSVSSLSSESTQSISSESTPSSESSQSISSESTSSSESSTSSQSVSSESTPSSESTQSISSESSQSSISSGSSGSSESTQSASSESSGSSESTQSISSESSVSSGSSESSESSESTQSASSESSLSSVSSGSSGSSESTQSPSSESSVSSESTQSPSSESSQSSISSGSSESTQSESSSSSLQYSESSESSSSFDFELKGFTLLYINRTDKYWTPVFTRGL